MSHHASGPYNGRGISVIIPTLNEVGNVSILVERLEKTLAGIAHELIFIDDNSTDGTPQRLRELRNDHNLIVVTKQGKSGKAFSLIEGFRLARYDHVAMIDADLQYPPEAIPPMLEVIAEGRADVVVGDRKVAGGSRTRKLLSHMFRVVVGQVMWHVDVDVQSGLKVFKKELVDCVPLNPKYAWAFDLEFLLCASNGGYKLAGYPIDFANRTAGDTKVKLIPAAKQLTLSSLYLRMNPPYHIPFHESARQAEGQGFHFRSQKYVTHTSLGLSDMAVTRTSTTQRLVLVLGLVSVVAAFLINWHTALIVLISIVTLVYISDLLFNLYLILNSFYDEPEIKITEKDISRRFDWPKYTIFCPMYKESAVMPQFVEAIASIEYPHDKLEVLLLLEEDDEETIRDVRAMYLPDYFHLVVVPHSLPKTKPKACNYGLLRATGKYAVIYDAEDIPDPLQLKKAVVAFDRADRSVGCVQAKLNYYNSDQNTLTRLFTLEYSLWFNLVLTGLQSIRSVIPLGGTSNHFRVRDLRDFEGWDPFNVTEDADLGIRLAKRGMRTAILDSFTMEEANSELKNWMKQRSRWIKGYMQTYLVHMRGPRELMRHRKGHILTMQLVVGGKVLSMLVNPLLWAMTLTYFLIPGTNAFIESLYLSPVFYLAIISLVFGNFLYMYYYMLGAAKYGRLELVLYALLIPFYWLMMSVAAFYAIRELIVRPHHWHKTKHGLHLQAAPTAEEVPVAETT